MSNDSVRESMRASDQYIDAIKLLLAKDPSSTLRSELQNTLATAEKEREALSSAESWGVQSTVVAGRSYRRSARRARRNRARAKILATAKGLSWDQLSETTQQRWIHATGWVMKRQAPSARFFTGIDPMNTLEIVAADLANHLDREPSLWSKVPKSRQVEWRLVARAVLKLR